MSKHSFNIALAVKIGVEKALIIDELESMCLYKKNNDLNEKDGKHWVYYSSEALSKKFPYFKPSSIRRWMAELEEDGYIESAYLSSDKRDRVKWYHVQSNEHCIAQNEQSPIDQNEQCNIYDTPPSKYTPHSLDKGYTDYLAYVNGKTNKHYRGDSKSSRSFAARLKNYTFEELLKVVDNATLDKYHVENGFKYLTPEFLLREDKVDKFLNAEVKLLGLTSKEKDRLYSLDISNHQQGYDYMVANGLWEEYQDLKTRYAANPN